MLIACFVLALLQRTKSLGSLILKGNEIGGRGSDKLSESLREQTTLHTLSLNSNPLGDEAVCKIAQMLVRDCVLSISC